MLTERQQKVLDFIIRQYVKNAEPVGSSSVFEGGSLDVSSATIRNEMQVLEDGGYLQQPHTSAGRVPTDKAYRYFVNNLIGQQEYHLDPRSRRKIDGALQETADDPWAINRTIADVLKDLSEALVITNVEEPIGQPQGFYKTGLTQLFEFPEFREFDRMFQMTNFFEHFDQLFNRLETELFEQSAEEPSSIRVLIGRENPYPNIKDESVLVARYQLPHRRVGSVTVIGPTRMNYGRNIALVRYTIDRVNKISKE